MMLDKLAIGSQAPDFRLTGTDGNEYNLQSFADSKLLVVIFSCNHCPYVQAYEERMIHLQSQFHNSEVQIIAINANDSEKYPEDSFVAMQQRASSKKYNFPYLHDITQTVAKAYKAEFTPEVFLLDQKRHLAYYGKIDDNWNNPEKVKTKYLCDAIEQLLQGKPIRVPETYAIGCTIKWKE